MRLVSFRLCDILLCRCVTVRLSHLLILLPGQLTNQKLLLLLVLRIMTRLVGYVGNLMLIPVIFQIRSDMLGNTEEHYPGGHRLEKGTVGNNGHTAVNT